MIFKRLLFLISLFSLYSFFLQAQTVAEARAQSLGSTVTVRGIVTNGPELGKIRYLQDATAGIAAYPGAGSVAGFDGVVFPGDSIEITGTMVSFHEMLEITPITAFTILSSGHPMPSPKPITIAQISDDLESQVVAFDCVTFSNAGGVFNNSGSYNFTDTAGASAKLILRSGHPLIGTSIPAQSVRLVSILSQYDTYQILPRTTSDFLPASCFFFTQLPQQTAIGTTGFAVNWKTSVPTNGALRIDTVLNPGPSSGLTIASTDTDHSYVFTGLLPGTIYWVQVEAESNGGSILSDPVPFATQSLSSGKVEVFFNHGIDPAFANGNIPDGETTDAVLNETITRINAAQQSLDVAIYNNNRADITNALKAAQTRGVRVRYIAAEAASNTALNPAPNFPVLYGNTAALMHNKFMVVDADLTDKSWVMGGSMNWTTQNMNTDFNNTLFIQDQSLARTYKIEFEEMWGTKGGLPDTANSRFGAAKRNNTPHHFIIGGHAVESYFSPSDQTTSHIERVLRSADTEALFATFSFTKNELGDALVAVHAAGVPVRGIMENISDQGAEYDNLLANGVNVRHHYLPGDFHHKYAVVDAYDSNSDPTVVTGSHNWSVSAETANDENTLILHDPVIATLYKAEFEKRWEAFPVGVQTPTEPLFKVFPNPVRNELQLQDLPLEAGMIRVKNCLGQTLLSLPYQAEKQVSLSVVNLVPGQYFVTFVSTHVVASVPFQKI